MTDLLDPPRGDADLVFEVEPVVDPGVIPLEDDYIRYAVLPEADPSQGPAHVAWAANRQLAYRALAEVGAGIITVEKEDDQRQEVFHVYERVGWAAVNGFLSYLDWMSGESFDHFQMAPRGTGAVALSEAQAMAHVRSAMGPSGLTERLQQANQLSNR